MIRLNYQCGLRVFCVSVVTTVNVGYIITLIMINIKTKLKKLILDSFEIYLMK